MRTLVALAVPAAMVVIGIPLLASLTVYHFGYVALALFTIASASALIAGLRRSRVRRQLMMLISGAFGIAWTSILLVVWTFAAAGDYNARELDPYHQSDPMLVVFPILVPMAFGISSLAVAAGLTWKLVADHRQWVATRSVT